MQPRGKPGRKAKPKEGAQTPASAVDLTADTASAVAAAAVTPETRTPGTVASLQCCLAAQCLQWNPHWVTWLPCVDGGLVSMVTEHLHTKIPCLCGHADGQRAAKAGGLPHCPSLEASGVWHPYRSTSLQQPGG